MTHELNLGDTLRIFVRRVDGHQYEGHVEYPDKELSDLWTGTVDMQNANLADFELHAASAKCLKEVTGLQGCQVRTVLWKVFGRVASDREVSVCVRSEDLATA